MLFALALTVASFAASPPDVAVPDEPDEIVLTDGRKLRGRILCETKDELRIRAGRGEVEVARTSVASVRSIERSLDDFIRRWDEMPRTDVGALTDLATFCESRGLPGEARNLRVRILLLEPSNEAAARAIGATKSEGRWVITVDKRTKRLDEFLAAKPRWRDAVELSTTHFLVRTDLPLERVLDATIQLERHYLRFYHELGRELALYSFNEVPEVNVYADERGYPTPPLLGERSWFQPGINQLHVLAQDPLDLRIIQRDITALLLYNALRQSSGHNGEMQAWASRGLCEYFAASAGHNVGDPWAPLGTPSHLLFDAAARDPKPPTLQRLLTTARSEFRSGPDGERRSMFAYTFVHFLMDAGGGEHREKFYEYVRDAWLGGGGTQLLYTSVGMKPRELELRWLDHVQAVANGR
jgi:hypothetical protein